MNGRTLALSRHGTQGFFQFGEARLGRAGHVAAADFDTDLSSIAMQVRHQHGQDDSVEGAVLVANFLHARREGADQAIGEEHAKEDADKGRKGVGQVLHGMGRCQVFVMVLLQLLFHGVLDLVRVFEVHGHHPQGVADEVDSEVILSDLGKTRKDRSFAGLFDVAFQGDHALGFHGLGQKEQQAQQVTLIR